MSNPSVALYVANRLSELGIDRVFGVPGDYAFCFNDEVEKCPALLWVACANELNAAYAADGYARTKGAAILSTTYGVGELSALNGVMGSLSQRVPVFHVVGAPPRRIVNQKLITHHSLGDGIYGNFEAISEATTCAKAFLTPQNAIEELERLIEAVLAQSKPGYIVIPMDYGYLPIIGTPIKGKPMIDIKRQTSLDSEVEAAVNAIVNRLKQAKNPVVLPAMLTRNYGLKDKLEAFLTKSNIPFATTPADKGIVSESHPGYAGIYNGDSSYPPEVRDFVQSSDLILDVGGIVFEDLTTGLWTDSISEEQLITVNDNWVQIGTSIWLGASIDDVLNVLIEKAPVFGKRENIPAYPVRTISGFDSDPTSSAVFYPRLEKMLKPRDILVSETGTCMLHLVKLRLPEHAVYEIQALWGSIGWATAATLGVTMAHTTGRTIMVTGDGAHQMTLNELAVMGRYGIKPIIFVLNNGIYGVEDLLSERGHEYDNLAPVNYHLLPEAFGCKGWLAAKVSTVGELDDIIGQIETHDGAAYVEVMIPESESQPLPESMKERIYKFRTPTH